MPYDYQYTIDSESQITARTDGSGDVDHQIKAESLEVDGNGDPIIEDNWIVVPGRSKTFVMPGSEMESALGSGTTQQKVKAYKDMLVTFADHQAVPITGWEQAEMTECLDNNKLSVAARQTFLDFLDTLGSNGDFPLSFKLDL